VEELTRQEATRCGNCGHVEPLTDDLEELAFQWLDEVTTKTACRACGSYAIMRAWAVVNGIPVGGEMLTVKTSLQAKGVNANARSNDRH
jgi:hypothetical protein